MTDRRLLYIDAERRRWWLGSLNAATLDKSPREDYFLLSGEALCQYVLRHDPRALVIARGPLPYLAGNKATLGYISPLTGLPHYSFVGGQAAAQLFNLGLDAIVLYPATDNRVSVYLTVSGCAPDLEVVFHPSESLPRGQRSSYYYLLAHELGGDPAAGSIFTVGYAAYNGYRSANVAVDAIYHAGRGGCGSVFVRAATALVLRAERTIEASDWFPDDITGFSRRPNALLMPFLERYCERFMRFDGGTILKMVETGQGARPTLPAFNARQLGYSAADLGSPRVLKATRHGRTGCYWCPVDCRFYHWVEAEYAPGGFDRLLDDFEPTYAIFAMLGLQPENPSLEALIALRKKVDRQLILPIEELGLDIIDVGLALAALFEGIEGGLIPLQDLPAELHDARLGDLSSVARAIEWLRLGGPGMGKALEAVAHGPQALAQVYPELSDRVFTSGRGTLGNAGHCNALWTFLMPFSRFFGHYVGQIYKIEEELPPPTAPRLEYQQCFERVVRRILQREQFWLLANVLSQCAFTFVIFSQDGAGECLSDDNLLVQVLRRYGFTVTREDLLWFSQAFWAQSIDLKCSFGWYPPVANDLPARVYEALSLALGRPVGELRMLMEMLIEEWKRQAAALLTRFGYEPAWVSAGEDVERVSLDRHE